MLKIRFKRGTSAQNDALTENAGVLTLDTDVFGLRIHDGVTAGGHALVVGAGVNSLQSQIDALGIADVDSLDAALAAKAGVDLLGSNDGIATLNPEGVVPTEQLPSYVEDIIEIATLANLPATGEIGKLYVVTDLNELYRWSGGQSQYYQISTTIESTDDVSEGQVNLYYTDEKSRQSFDSAGLVSYDPATGVFTLNESINSVEGRTGAVVVDKTDVGLGSVENYGIASDTEAQEGQVSNKYVVPSNVRALVEYMGFSDSDGSWALSPSSLPRIGLNGIYTDLGSIGYGNVSQQQSVYYNGKVYVTGGFNGSAHINTLLEYDIAGNTISSLANIPVTVSAHSAHAYNGKIYLTGGLVTNNVRNDAVYIYDIAGDTWSTGATAPTGATYQSSALVGDKIYVIGGSTDRNTFRDTFFAEYDISSDAWTELAALPWEVYGGSATAVGSKIYQFSGNKSTGYNAGLWVYDTAVPANGWTLLGYGGIRDQKHENRLFTMVGKVYLFGPDNTGDLFEYDPVAEEWLQLTSFTDYSISGFSVVSDGTSAYATGGYPGNIIKID